MLIKTSPKNKNTKLSLSAKRAFAVLALFFMPFLTLPTNANALSLNDRIDNAENALQQTQSKRNSLAAEVARFNSEIATTENDIYATNLKIGDLNQKITKTANNISAAERELAKLKSQLQEIIRVMYEEGQISSLEIIAKSGSFSEYVNRSEYLEQINLKVKQSSDGVVALRTKLENDKKQLEENKARVTKEKEKIVAERNALAVSRNARNLLLVQTKGDETAYKKLLNKLYAERAALAARNGEVVRGGGTGGYPYTNSCGGVDPWRFYKCQCTSYAAWNWNRVQGKSWQRTQSGNAWNWPALARDQGYTVSSQPRVGAIAVWGINQVPGGYGHVAIVTAVYGNRMSVAEYNYTIPEGYGTRDNVSYSGLSFIY